MLKMENKKEVLKGEIYKHYKGGMYEIFGESLHTETSETLVLYFAVGKSQLFARPLEMFLETVEVDGRIVDRFQKVSQN